MVYNMTFCRMSENNIDRAFELLLPQHDGCIILRRSIMDYVYISGRAIMLQ